MGGGLGKGLDFGATVGSGKLSLWCTNVEPGFIPAEDFTVGRSLSSAPHNYDVVDPKTGKAYKFLEGTTIHNVVVFAGKGVRNKLKPEVAQGLAKHYGGRPRDWRHVKGIGKLDVDGHAAEAEVHWFEVSGQQKVKFRIKRWL